MPNSEARVPTRRAGRYLAQLCRHADAISRRPGQRLHDHPGPEHMHPRIRRVEWTDTVATLNFDQGRCVVRADRDGITLRAETDDPQSLRRIQSLIAADLERFGAREHLKVAWRNDDNSNRPHHDDHLDDDKDQEDHAHDHSHGRHNIRPDPPTDSARCGAGSDTR